MLGAEEHGVFGGVGFGEIEDIAPRLPRSVGGDGTGVHDDGAARGHTLVGIRAQGRHMIQRSAGALVGGRGIHGHPRDEKAPHSDGGDQDQHRQGRRQNVHLTSGCPPAASVGVSADLYTPFQSLDAAIHHGDHAAGDDALVIQPLGLGDGQVGDQR